MVSQLTGDWRRALELSDRGLAVSLRDLRLVGNGVLLEHEAGRPEPRDTYFQMLLQLRQDDSSLLGTHAFVCSLVVPLVNRVTGGTDGMELAQRIAKNALSSSSSPPLLNLMARAGLALIAIIEKDVVSAREQYDAMHPHRGKLVPNRAGCTVDRLLGLLSQTMGNPSQAVEHFEGSLDFCKMAGYRPEFAWTCCDYADTLLERDSAGDQAKANSLLDESLAICGGLGMQTLEERVLSRR